jgi:hypothetical protein
MLTPEVEKSAMIKAHKNFLAFMIVTSKNWFPAGPTAAGKNEGESLHIGSPSTIPLTLGEEMAVLLLPT